MFGLGILNSHHNKKEVTDEERKKHTHYLVAPILGSNVWLHCVAYRPEWFRSQDLSNRHSLHCYFVFVVCRSSHNYYPRQLMVILCHFRSMMYASNYSLPKQFHAQYPDRTGTHVDVPAFAAYRLALFFDWAPVTYFGTEHLTIYFFSSLWRTFLPNLWTFDFSVAHRHRRRHFYHLHATHCCDCSHPSNCSNSHVKLVDYLAQRRYQQSLQSPMRPNFVPIE